MNYLLKYSVAIFTFVIAIFLFGATQAQAATVTWDNDNADGLWNTAANWSGGSVPSDTDDVVFDGTSTDDCALNVATDTVGSLSINSGYTGTFSLGSNALIIGDFTQAVGTFTIGSSGSLSVSGNFTISGGTFTADDASLMTFNGSSNSVIDVNSTITFGSMTVSKSAQSYETTFAANDIVYVTEGLTLTTGEVLTGTGNYIEMINDATLNESTETIITMLVKFTGTSAQTIDDSQIYGPVEVNKASGTVALNSDGMHSTFTVTSGTVQQGSQDLTIGNGSGSDTLHINGGTYNGPALGSHHIDIWDDVIVDSGTYDFGLGGFYMASNGTFTQNGGTVVSDGEGTVSTSGAILLTGGTMTIDPGTFTASGTFTQTGGTFTIGSLLDSDFATFSGAVSLTGGTYNITTAGNIYFTGGVTLTDGNTFNAGTTGNVNLTGTGQTVSIESVWQLYDLYITTTAADDIINISSGTIQTTGKMYLNEGVINTGTLNPLGDIDVAGLNSGSAALLFNNTADQTLYSSASQSGSLNVTVNKSSGTVTLNSVYISKVGYADWNPLDFTMTSGTMDMRYVGVEVQGDFVQTGGTIMTTSTDVEKGLYAYGSWTHDGGSYTGSNIGYLGTDTAITMNGGSVTMCSPSCDPSDSWAWIAGTLTLNGGTFTLGSQYDWIIGDFVENGGTFAHGDGKVLINSTGQDGNSWSNISSVSFYDFQMNDAGNSRDFSGDTWIVENDILYTDGVMNNGTFQVQGNATVGATYDGGTAGVEFTGTNAQTFDLTGATDKFNGDVTINKTSGTAALGSALVMDTTGQDVTITSGTFDVGNNYAISVAGNWTNNATFTPGTGTVTFVGAGTSTFAGNTTFNDLTCTTASKPLVFATGSNQSVTGTLTLTGTSGNEITMRGATPGSLWFLNASGTTSVEYVDVSDSDARAGNTISPTDSIDSGRNYNWWFPYSSSISDISLDPELIFVGTEENKYQEIDDLVQGTNEIVFWDANGVVYFVNVYYTTDVEPEIALAHLNTKEGLTAILIVERALNVGRYTWEVPADLDGEIQLIVELTDGKVIVDTMISDVVLVGEYVSIVVPVDDDEDDDDQGKDDQGEDDTDGETDDTDLEIIDDILALGIHAFFKTISDPTIYYRHDDLARRPFLNMQILMTWADSLDVIEFVSSGLMSDMPLGAPMLPKPGVTLIQIESQPHIYATFEDPYDEDKVMLRKIANDETAELLFGQNWEKYILEVPPTFWSRFTIGESLDVMSVINTGMMKDVEELN